MLVCDPSPTTPWAQQALAQLRWRDLVSTEIDASTQRLRLVCHPIAFIFHGGIADRVICPSTAPNFWQDVIAACEPPDLARPKHVESHRPELDQLLQFVGDMLWWRDEATKNRGIYPQTYIDGIKAAMRAYQYHPHTLSAAHNTILQNVSSSLSHLAILRFRGLVSTSWAIGPRDSQVGDWVMPILVSPPEQYVPMMCLIPINLPGAENLKLLQIPLTISIRRRCLRFFSGENNTEVSCRHMVASFIGHAIRHGSSTPDLNSLLGDNWDGDYDEENEQTPEIIVRAVQVAKDRGLPGALVFDVV